MTDPLSCRLDEITRDEWLDAMRKTIPDLTDEDFEEAWEEFQAKKRARMQQ